MKQKHLLKSLLLLAAMLAGVSNANAADKWVKTVPADLATGDIVVIVDQTSSRAMSNNNGTSSAPSATAVTLSTDKSEISGDVAATLQWEVTVDNGSYQFGVGDDFLYCTATNNGVRVGSNSNNVFTWKQADANTTEYFLHNTATSRYVGVYNNQDWRCYTTVNANIKATVTSFYKKVTASGPVNPNVSISKSTFAVGETASITGPEGLSMSFESDDEDIATVSNAGVVTGVAAGTATITAKWSAVEGTYNAGSKDFEITITNPVAKTVYEKVTEAGQLVAGNEYILVAEGYGMAMGAQNSSIRTNVAVTIANDKVSITNEAVAVLTLGGSTGAWTFLASDNSKYLALTSSSNAIHASDDAEANGSKWTVTSDFILKNNAFTTRVLQYNSGSPRFACYENTQKDAVLYVKSGSASDNRVDPGFSFSAETAEAALGEPFTAPTFSNPNNVDVTFESTNTEVATINENGEVTILAAGTTTIKATSEANETYLAGEASYTLTVTDPNAPGTENNPYTVAQARAAIAAGTGVTGVYATGIVSEIVTAYSSQYGNISYNISEDGTTTADQLQAYRGKGKDGANFTSEDDIQVGDVVVIYGNLTKYGDTYEFAANNQLVSLDRPASTTPSITVADAMVSVDAGEHDGTLDITYENLSITDMEDFDIQYYDAEGEETSEPDWIEVLVAEQDPEVGEGYVVSYYMAENEGEARTAYFKVYALDEDANEVYSGLVTITQAAYVAPAEPGNWVLTDLTDLTENDVFVIVGDNGDTYALPNDGGASSAPAAVAVTVVEGTLSGEIAANLQWTLTTGEEGYIFYPNGNNESWLYCINNNNGLRVGTNDNKYFTIDNGYLKNVATSRYVGIYNSQDWRCYTNTTGNIAGQTFSFYKKVSADEESISISAAGYRTYCSDYPLDFSDVEGLTAYKATITDNKLSFIKVEQVPAGEGVLLKGAADTYEVPVIASAAELEDNEFIGVTKETTIDTDPENGIFVLMNPEGGQGVGFYKTTGSTFTLGAHTAYLPATAGARSFIGFDFDNTTTAIKGVATVESHDGEVYNLQGQRVVKAQKGLYIINGKKVVLK